MAVILETRALTHRFGKKVVLNDLSLSVEQGAIYGFVGPNGAGKTTTMRVLTTLLRPTAGEALVAGHSAIREPEAVRRVIGYMPDFFGVYDDMTVWEYLDFFAGCYRIPEAQRPALIGDLLELVDLAHRRSDPVDNLSRGMKQRLCLARTLVHDPQVLILDEPASGLDPRARIEIRELLLELSRLGKTIFFSTHILADVAEICTQVGIVEAGRLVAQGSLADIQRRLRPHRRVRITLLSHAQEAAEALFGREGVLETRIIQAGGAEPYPALEVDFTGDDAATSAMLAALVSRNIPILRFTETAEKMEDLFMQVTQGQVT